MKTLIFFILLSIPGVIAAAIPETYTNENFYTSEHDMPISLFQDGAGGFYGYTQTGMFYTQKPVPDSSGIRMHKFSIGEAFFYVSDRGIIQAPDVLSAVTIYRSRM